MLITRVNAHGPLQVSIFTESLRTLLTPKWLVTIMNAHVTYSARFIDGQGFMKLKIAVKWSHRVT